MSPRSNRQIPTISRPLLSGFQWFVARYLKKHFHCVAVNRRQLIAATDCFGETFAPQDTLLVYANHASWWDPLAAIFVAQRLFGDFSMYAPMDADALHKYPMFGRMGFFGVQQKAMRGAAEFLQLSECILSRPGSSLWVTPEGRFADVRDTSAPLMPGLAHLAWKFSKLQTSAEKNAGPDQLVGDSTPIGRVWFIPVAVEYTFWEERQPELLFWFGNPLAVNAHRHLSKPQWDHELTERLRAAQRELAHVVIARDASQFESLLGGTAGSFFLYDWWRQFLGIVRRQPIRVEHGQKLNER